MGGFIVIKTICFVARDRRGDPTFPILDCNRMELVSSLSLCQVGREPTEIINLLTFRHEVMIDWGREREEVGTCRTTLAKFARGLRTWHFRSGPPGRPLKQRERNSV